MHQYHKHQPLRKWKHPQWQICLQQAAARCHRDIESVCNYSQQPRQSFRRAKVFRRACLIFLVYLPIKNNSKSKYHLEKTEWFLDPELIKLILSPSRLSPRLEGPHFALTSQQLKVPQLPWNHQAPISTRDLDDALKKTVSSFRSEPKHDSDAAGQRSPCRQNMQLTCKISNSGSGCQTHEEHQIWLFLGAPPLMEVRYFMT